MELEEEEEEEEEDRLIFGGEVVSLTHRPPFTPHEDSWYSFLSIDLCKTKPTQEEERDEKGYNTALSKYLFRNIFMY
jgi:hypothetical protein